MFLHIMLYVMLACAMPFSALLSAICLLFFPLIFAALATDICIAIGYRLFMNDTHSPSVSGICFVISP